MKIEYSFPKRKKQPFFAVIKFLMRPIYRRVKTVVLGPQLDNKCLYIINHANKSGPIIYDMYFPVRTVKWAAHQMLGNYASRKAYLRDVLYIQKNKMKKSAAAFKATFEAMFSPFFYKGMKMLPTYSGLKQMSTVKKSVRALDDDTALMIFPEDSTDGYFDVPKKIPRRVRVRNGTVLSHSRRGYPRSRHVLPQQKTAYRSG